jgi:hypothetical protein
MTEHLKPELDLSEIRRLVTALDSLVSAPAEKSVRLQQIGGGPDESGIEATQAGALKLGVIILNAALEDDASLRFKNFDRGLESLLTDDSDIGFDSFVRRDTLTGRWNVSVVEELGAFRATVLAGTMILTLGVVFWLYWIFV